MTTNPVKLPELARQLFDLSRRVREIELRLRKTVKAARYRFVDLTDVKWLGAVDGSWPIWDATTQTLVPGGGDMVSFTFTDSGFGSPVISEALTDANLDPAKPCLVTATLDVDTSGFGWGPEIVPGDPSYDITIAGSVDIDITGMGVTACSFPDPVSMTFPEAAGLGGYIAHPTAGLQVYDPGDPYQISAHQFDLLTTGNGSVAWLFPTGTPTIVASVVGASPYTSDSPDLTLVVRVLPLP